MRPLQLTSAALAFGAASLLTGRAGATDCTTLPNPVYVVGSTAIGPVIIKIAQYLAVQSPPVSVVYGPTGSCAGVASTVNTVVNPSLAAVVTPSGKSNFFTYSDNTGTKQSCDITASDAGTPILPNIGMSDAFAESCQSLPNGLSSLGITDHLGPVQAMTFVVPTNSTEYAISAEAAYFVFGFGSNSNVAPWTDVMHIFQRGPTSGTQAMLAVGIKVPSAQWYGVITAGTNGMIASLTAANAAMDSKAIGILGATDIDPLRRAGSPAMRMLAYKHFGQNCGYLPDSGAGTYDKRNVRDGHYAIWGPLHVYPLPTTDPKVKANIDTIVSYLTGTAPTGSLDVIASEAQSGVIPQCAMRVQRSKEVGPMTPFSPTNPCGCYYEYSGSPSHTTSCKTCQKDTDCPTNYTCPLYSGMGWCEAP